MVFRKRVIYNQYNRRLKRNVPRGRFYPDGDNKGIMVNPDTGEHYRDSKTWFRCMRR